MLSTLSQWFDSDLINQECSKHLKLGKAAQSTTVLGFVHLICETESRWHDYSGSGTYESFSSLAQDDRAARLFLDFSTCDSFQMSGC